MKALVGAFNQEKALVGAFSVIVQPVVEPMEYYTALVLVHGDAQPRGGAGLRGRDSRRHVLLVILVQTQVVAADVALDM